MTTQLTDEKRGRILRLCARGVLVSKVAELEDVSYQSVYNIIDRHNATEGVRKIPRRLRKDKRDNKGRKFGVSV